MERFSFGQNGTQTQKLWSDQRVHLGRKFTYYDHHSIKVNLLVISSEYVGMPALQVTYHFRGGATGPAGLVLAEPLFGIPVP